MRIRSRLWFAPLVFVALVAVVALAGWLLVPSWSVSATATSAGSPAQIWAWYTDAPKIPDWDHLVSHVTVTGPFVSGTTGTNVATNGLVMPWRLDDVVKNRRYTEISAVPLATLTATHVLAPLAHGTRIDHALVVSGPGAWIYRLAAYGQMNDGIHAAMQLLATGAPHGLPK